VSERRELPLLGKRYFLTTAAEKEISFYKEHFTDLSKLNLLMVV